MAGWTVVGGFRLHGPRLAESQLYLGPWDEHWCEFAPIETINNQDSKKRKTKKKRKKTKVTVVRHASAALFPPPTFLNSTSFCVQSPLPHFSSSLLGLASPPTPPDMASLQGGPSRIRTPAPLTPLPTTGNLDYLVSLFHQTPADLGLTAAGFAPITPAKISTLSIGEQMLLPLVCRSLQWNGHIATTLENLATEIDDRSSQVGNLDLSPQGPDLAPLQASLC